jgi:outer membrane protein OmpA-like peptidoglycan-associated protein/chemotaxis protein histidine kinase CheA
MKYKLLLAALFAVALQLGCINQTKAQSKEELEQLKSSPSLEMKENSKWKKKPAKKSKAELAAEAKEEAERAEAEKRAAEKKAAADKKAAEQKEAERKAIEKEMADRKAAEQKAAELKAAEEKKAAEQRAAEAAKEQAMQAEQAKAAAKEEAKPAPKSEPVKAEPKKEEPKPAKTEAKKEEPKPAAAPAKTEPKKEESKPAAEPAKTAAPKKEEPAPAPKSEPVKAEPKKEEPKKEEPKPAKTEPVKATTVKEEPKPAKTETKKEETKPATTAAPVKAEPKKEEPKPATTTAPAVSEPVKPQPVVAQPVVSKPAPVTETVVIEPRKVPTQLDEVTPASNEKTKELPEPGSGGFGRNKRLGKRLFKRGSISNGLRYYEAALTKKPKKTFINQPLADGYFLMRDYTAANKYYKTLVAIDSVKHKNLFALYQYALTEKYLGNYEVAKENFNSFNRLAKDVPELAEQRKSANLEAQGCDLALELQKNTDLKYYKIQHLSEAINLPFTDYSPYLKDANTLYFGSWASDKVILENKKEKYGTFSRIYQATRKGTTWVKSEEVKGEVNNVKAHTGNAAFTDDGKTMYYTQCLQDDVQRMRCKIYRGTFGADGWSAGEEIKTVNAEGFTTTHPALGKSPAGKDVLYFSSDRSGKGMDIYYAEINSDGTLAKPQLIGGNINTSGDEMTPFYDAKNQTLYFSSNGHVNIGATDVFKSVLKDGEWGTPENLGLPVNSSLDDMYFMWNDQASVGFMVSNRPGGFYSQKSTAVSDDIYQVDLNKIYLAVTGTQTDLDSNKAIPNGVITLYDQASGNEIKSFYAAEGTYLFDLKHDQNYKLVARNKYYEDVTATVSTMGKRSSDTVTVNFSMRQIPGAKSRVGERLGIVYWEFNVDHLKKDAPDTLATVVNFMNDNPLYVVEVGSHTDSKGTDEYNLKLAQRRSDAVTKYLLSKQIPQYRIESKAYGESQPLELNENPPGTDNPDGRAKNRRTEFKVIKQLTAEEQQQLQAAEEEAQKKKVKRARAIQNKATAMPATK